MMRIISLLIVAPAVPAENAMQWAHQVEMDKSQIDTKTKSLNNSLNSLTLLEQDDAKIQGFANAAQQEAVTTYQSRIQDAKNSYRTSLADLKALPATANKTSAENKVKEHKKALSKLEEEEQDFAKKKLSDMRQSHKDEVLKTLGDTKDAVHKMKKDRNHLEDARRSEGWSEKQFEREEMNNEKWAEHSQLYAEQQKDHAAEVVDRIFGRAEQHLEGLMATAKATQEVSAAQDFLAAQDSCDNPAPFVGCNPASLVASVALCLLATVSAGFAVLASLRKRPTPVIPDGPLFG